MIKNGTTIEHIKDPHKRDPENKEIEVWTFDRTEIGDYSITKIPYQL